jgi:mono/diheme cytochrome c family protein
MIGLSLIVAVVLVPPGAFPDGASSRPPVDYAKEVKPLLAQRCVACHGEARPRGGLRLDTALHAKKGGKAGPSVIAGKSGQSPLIEAIKGDGAIERMPLKRPGLSPEEIALLARWIDEGAISPENEVPTRLNETHWAFLPPQRPTVPLVGQGKGEIVPHPIDAFIREKLAKAGVAPSPEAEKTTLIRRVKLDLVGLPPTQTEVNQFLADERPDAYERLVDRLLASPHFGERWARPWLDAARYADSNGYSIDAPRSIWSYRDWVIKAINRDLPFDQFVIDQVAGDLRPNATLDQRVATGFHRNTPLNQEGGIDQEQFRIESIYDRVSTTSTVFLGLTMGCAQCHDHKYDPIAQREYYELFAFLNSVEEPTLEFATDKDLAAREAIRKEIADYHITLNNRHPEIAHRLKDWEANLTPAFKVDQPPEIKDSFDRAVDKRTENQVRLLTELFLADTPEYKADQKALAALRKRVPVFDTTLVVSELKTPRVTQIHLGGDFTRKGAGVNPGVPAVLPKIKPRNPQKPDRLDLANWLVDPANPLTARVTVNRIWQSYFGRGIVETENDFGTQGTPPSHAELLDWLATELISQNWSMKALHREIVLSKTYRQASISRPDLDRVDPDNRLLGRQSRMRLEAELIRDSALSVSGLLNPTIGGPSVFPHQPNGVMDLGQMKRPWKPSNGSDRYRRGLYTFFWRATPFPALLVFDAPNSIQACTKRNRSNTPIQALTLLNDASFLECADFLVKRIESEGGGTDRARIDFLFKTALGRAATQPETETIGRLLFAERNDLQIEAAKREKSAWLAVARVLLNTDEFITRE